VKDICVAVGIKRNGIDFESMDGEPSKIFIMVLSPRKTSGPHVQFLAAVSAVLNDDEIRQKVIEAESRFEVVSLLRRKKL
ncbi:MAG: PTS sugar transporter subunit IIA, partial [Treponema sp.]|nr:PTS sugar transporter subunit IIA [Treponema sp.]